MNQGEFSLVKELLLKIDNKQDKLSEKVEDVRGETAKRLDHLDECIDNVRDVVRESNARLQAMIEDVADAIPDRDYIGHRIAHTKKMADASDAHQLKLEAKKTAIRWGLPAALGFIGLALWEAFKRQLFL